MKIGVIGQIVIPIPVVGAVVGGLVGGIVGAAIGQGEGIRKLLVIY